MAKNEIETQLMGKMQFNALINGRTITMDAPEKAGGEDVSPTPKRFVLAAPEWTLQCCCAKNIPFGIKSLLFYP